MSERAEIRGFSGSLSHLGLTLPGGRERSEQRRQGTKLGFLPSCGPGSQHFLLASFDLGGHPHPDSGESGARRSLSLILCVFPLECSSPHSTLCREPEHSGAGEALRYSPLRGISQWGSGELNSGPGLPATGSRGPGPL